MDLYEKKYKETLEKIKTLIDKDHNDINVDDVLNIFPELKESEDEKIRKSIYNYINVTLDDNESEEKEKWIAWLEKQGEQKPTWSEEDEAALSDALWYCKQAASIAKDENDMGNIWYAEHWLKSIKQRIGG